jgi:methylmalonyl-CoA mutase C-terminal domain/subunit
MSAEVTTLPARVLVTKIGLDGHDRGSRIVASFLRDAGMEVIYTPPWQSIDAVINIARQEDIELIGISSLATDHLIVPELIEKLAAAGLGDIGIIVGGIVPESEHNDLITAGVSCIFGPGATREEIVARARELVAGTRSAREGDA